MMTVGIDARLKILSGMLCCLAFGICLRLYDLQGEEFAKWSTLARKQHESTVQVHGARGTILDAEGRTLAVSVRATAVGVHPKTFKDNGDTVPQLAKLLGTTPKEIREKLKSEKPFVWLAHGMPMNFAEELKPLKLEGVATVPEFKRYYPQGRLAGMVLGHLGRDGEGLSGVELGYQSLLTAPSMQVPVRRDARGRLFPALFSAPIGAGASSLSKLPSMLFDGGVMPAALSSQNEPGDPVIRKEGDSVTLTLDSMLQEILEQELIRGQEESQSKRMFGVLVDAVSGEVLALAQSPGFDPNQNEISSPEALRNSVIQDAFEPGSTLKPLVAALALDHRVITRNQTFDCENGSYPFGTHVIRDVHPEGILPLSDVLIRSSNICMAKIGQKLGKANLSDGLRVYGFGEPTKIQLPGQSRGILRNPEDWADIDVLTHSFGQGISVTALQLVQAYTALANEGLMVRPTLVKGAKSAPDITRVLSKESAQAIAEILRGVTVDEHGTGQKAGIPGITVSGKTGTAQKARTDGRGYDPDKILASFIGFVNGNEIGLSRRLVLLVAADEPGTKQRWGGTVAAPVFKRAMERILSHMLTREGPGAGKNAGVRSASLEAHSQVM
ncbi:MAG: penicillin-binding protein 2 [Bdellovibrionota bacterium]